MATYLVKGRRFSSASDAVDAALRAAARSRRPVQVSELGHGTLHVAFPDGNVGPAWQLTKDARRLNPMTKKKTTKRKAAPKSRAISLRNFTGKVRMNPDKTVSVLGVGKRGAAKKKAAKRRTR